MAIKATSMIYEAEVNKGTHMYMYATCPITELHAAMHEQGTW